MYTFQVNSSRDHQTASSDRLLLFDLSVGGHHPGYILHLIQYWNQQELSGYLDIVVLPEFMEQHNDVVDIAEKYGQIKTRFVPITQKERGFLSSRANFFSRKRLNFQEWGLFCKYAKLLKTTQALLMYFDTYQLPLFLGHNPPCPFSAIYFRPRFHYKDFKYYRSSRQERWDHKREKLYLSLVLRNRNLKTIFCLDPFVLKYIKQFNTSTKAIYLADPVKIYTNYVSNPNKIKADLGIDFHRKVFLLFGNLSGRKGIFKLLNAISLLPSTISQKLCILFVGPISLQDKQRVKSQIEQLKKYSTTQIVLYGNFLSDREIQKYFELANVILAPYQRHVGMSGILNRAAVAQKPVLSSDYGLMGEITYRYKLGLTVDSSKASAIAEGLTIFLTESPDKYCDRALMKQFAEQNTPQKFASTIFKHIF